MARNQRHYDTDYKVQSVNLAKEIGLSKAAREPGLAPSTLSGWVKATREGRLKAAPGAYTPKEAMSLADELAMLRLDMKKDCFFAEFSNLGVGNVPIADGIPGKV